MIKNIPEKLKLQCQLADLMAKQMMEHQYEAEDAILDATLQARRSRLAVVWAILAVAFLLLPLLCFAGDRERVSVADAEARVQAGQRKTLPNDFANKTGAAGVSEPITVEAQYKCTIFTAKSVYGPRWCPNCDAKKTALGTGNANLSIEWSDEVAPGDQVYPAVRFQRESGAWVQMPRGEDPGDCAAIIKWMRFNNAPTSSQAIGAPFKARGKIQEVFSLIRSRVGESVPIAARWDRTGAQSFPLLKAGTDWSAEAIFGRSGRMDLTAKGSTLLPITELGFGYRVDGADLILDADAIRFPGLADRISPRKAGAIGAVEPIGFISPLSLLSVIVVIYDIMHPSCDIELGGSISLEAVLVSDILTIKFSQCPRIRLTAYWQWLLGVEKVVITPAKIHVEFTNEKGVMLPIRSRDFEVSE